MIDLRFPPCPVTCGLFSNLLACVNQDKPAQKLTSTGDGETNKYFANDASPHVTVSALSPPLTHRLNHPQCPRRPQSRKPHVHIAALITAPDSGHVKCVCPLETTNTVMYSCTVSTSLYFPCKRRGDVVSLACL